MPQSIFLSYVHEDKQQREHVERWAESGKLGPNRVTVAESKDLRQQGDAAIKAHLEPKIRGAAAVVCLIGQDTHNHDWVKVELDLARSMNKKVILARVPGTTGSAPPGYSDEPIHTLDPSTLKKIL